MSICVVSRRHEWSVLNENPSKKFKNAFRNYPKLTSSH